MNIDPLSFSSPGFPGAVKPHKRSSLSALQASSAGRPARPFCGSGVCLVHAGVGAQASVFTIHSKCFLSSLLVSFRDKGLLVSSILAVATKSFCFAVAFFFLGCFISKILRPPVQSGRFSALTFRWKGEVPPELRICS